MRGVRLLFCLLFFVGQFGGFVPDAHAEETGGVVIAQMYAGTYSGDLSKQEIIELYNNSDSDIEITNWCIEYLSASGNKQWDVCFEPSSSTTNIYIASGGYAVLVSNQLNEAIPTSADAYFDGAIYQVKGYVQLVNSGKNIIDKLGWGDLDDDTYPAASKPLSGNSLLRKSNDNVMQDTDVDSDDFEESDKLLIHASNIYEVVSETDVCPNVAETQSEIPNGYLLDDEGDCQPDSCLNMDGLQVSVPDGYDSDDAGNCTLHDECDNLSDVQDEIPDFMVRDGTNDCIIEYSPLELTEILPNAVGEDSSNEFIEIHNSGNTSIDLTFYVLKIGLSGEKTISFPVGSIIGPDEYKSFSDSELKFTLVNTSSKVVLTAIGGKIFGDTGIYSDPKDGESWSFIDGQWEYTNRPTPNLSNLSSIMLAEDDDSADSSGLQPCNADQYRNPETNRCKKYETTSLKPCATGQYRSPETNRCRNSTAASTSLKPCAENQERNPTTNRCRKVDSGSVPDAGYAVEPIPDTPMVFAGWWALGGVGTLAGSYGAWEWRRELKSLWFRILGTFKK